MPRTHFCSPNNGIDADRFLHLGNSPTFGLPWRRVLIIGESFQKDGWVTGRKHFRRENGSIGPSGVNLNKLLAVIGTNLDQCSYTDLVKCVPDGGRIAPECLRVGWESLGRHLAQNDFGLLLVLGKPARNRFEETIGRPIPIAEINQANIQGRDLHLLALHHPSGANAGRWKPHLEDLKLLKPHIEKLVRA